MGRAGVVIALGAAQTLLWGGTYYLPAILAAPISVDLHLAPTTVFAAFSAALVVSAALGPAVGRRIDARGGRGTLALGALVSAAGLGLLAAAEGPVLLFGAWLVIGTGMALGLYEAAFSTLARLYGRGARGPITGVTLIAGFASTLGWPASAMMEAEFGWRGACLGWAGAALALALPLILSLPRAGPAAAPAHDPAAPPPPSAPGLAMALLGFVFGATWFVATAMAAHLPGLLQAAGATPAAAIAAAALVGPAQVAGRLLEFGAMRRVGPVASATAAAAAHPLGAAALLALGGPAAAGFALLHGAGAGVMTVARGSLPLALFGPEGYGLRQGVLAAPARLAAVAAPLAFAWALARWGAGAVWLSAGLSALALAAMLALRLTLRR